MSKVRSLEGKTIVLGITGSIAAFKAAEIARQMVKRGATVKVILTEAATKFITSLTFQTITSQRVATSLFEEEITHPVHHVSLAEEADLILVAPATANIIAKAAQGIADDLLSTTILAASAPVLLAPAMNSRMYLNPATQKNLSLLKSYGVVIIEPEKGELICGEGIGRLASVDAIVLAVESELSSEQHLKGKTVVVTAGGTQELIDPVRYLGNRSSGKMGYALATEARRRGARVILVSAPTYLETPAGAELIRVRTAGEMHQVVLSYYSEADAVIMAAAVADFRPSEEAKSKIKRIEEPITLELVPNPDILAELGAKKANQILIGFALESGYPGQTAAAHALRENLIEQGKEKLKRKNLDLIAINDVTKIGTDTNQVTLIEKTGKIEELPLMSKAELAKIIIDRLINLLQISFPNFSE